MKYAFSFLVAALLLQAQSASATLSQDCQAAYAQSVSTCAQSLNFLSPNMRAGAQKACVQDAKTQKDWCLAGHDVNACLASCQSTYDAAIVTCDTSYNPATNCASDDIFCQAIYTQLRSDCTSSAVTALNTCNTGCQL